MPDLNPEKLHLIVDSFVPGLIILFVRSQFLTGRLRFNSGTEALLSYLTVSIIYYGIMLPPFNFIILMFGFVNEKMLTWFAWITQIILGPALLGLLLGLNTQKNWLRSVLRKLRKIPNCTLRLLRSIAMQGPISGLRQFSRDSLTKLRHVLQKFQIRTVHPTPTAWDWKFGGINSQDQWVLVTLKDGSTFAGYYGKRSFTSSDPTNRDIYIQWVYDIDNDGNWSSLGEHGVLIAAGEIQVIEFWPTRHSKDQ